MVNVGAQLETGEQEAILAFLTERHGFVNVNAANAEELVALGLSKKDADAQSAPTESIMVRSLTSRPFSACPDSTLIG